MGLKMLKNVTNITFPLADTVIQRNVFTFQSPYTYIYIYINSWLCTIILWPDTSTFMFPVSCCLRLLRLQCGRSKQL